MTTNNERDHGAVGLGFRRRCGWCGVQLRWWQVNLCHVCGFHVHYDYPSPPCLGGSRWDAMPDRIGFR